MPGLWLENDTPVARPSSSSRSSPQTAFVTETQLTPDGGYGWVCVFAQFLINGFTWGVAASYSVYLAYFLSHDLFTEARPFDYAFIGGFNFAFALLVAPFATFLMRLYDVRTPMILGVISLPGGFVAASFSTKVWHLYLSYVCVGLGIGLIYIPATSVVPQWFTAKRSLANGICAAGSGIGGLIVCFSCQAMLDNLGLLWSLRTTAVVVFFTNLVATLLIRSRNKEIDPNQRMFNLRLLKGNYHAKLFLGWSIILMFGYITLMFSLSDYALAIGRSDRDSATIAAVLNLGAALGRPIIGYASDRLGRLEVAGVLTFTCGILVFAMWIPASAYGTLIAFSLISGAILGVFWAVVGPLAADIVGLKELPAFLSITWLSVAIPSVVAEAIALGLRRPGLGARSYLYPQIFTGVSYISSSLLLFELWRSRRNIP